MSKCGLVLDSRFQAHDSGPGHPENPDRLRAIERALSVQGLIDRCSPVPAVAAEDRWITAVHDERYVRMVDRVCAQGGDRLDEDTVTNPHSAEVARLAAGSLVALCREVAEGRLACGFAAVRPPGHHAEVDRAMGFCLFNNVAIAARYLLDHQGIERVLIVDWDVHHGNGTQHAFEEDPRVFYFSVHQSPLYPGTGASHETGRGAGAGATLNCPLAPGAGDAEFLDALRGPLNAAADRFRPQFVLVSAGFDAHAADPLAQLRVSTPAYSEATRIVQGIADRHASGRLVSVLEGGYDLVALSECVAAHLTVLNEAAAETIPASTSKAAFVTMAPPNQTATRRETPAESSAPAYDRASGPAASAVPHRKPLPGSDTLKGRVVPTGEPALKPRTTKPRVTARARTVKSDSPEVQSTSPALASASVHETRPAAKPRKPR